MKLLELLVKERIEWHNEALCYTQDADKECYPYCILSPKINAFYPDTWEDAGSINNYITLSELADDWDTAIVTRKQYENACKLVDDGYTLWFGGECPVDEQLCVDVVLEQNNIQTRIDTKPAEDFDWEWANLHNNIIAYKVKLPEWRSDDLINYPAYGFLEKGVQHMKDRADQRDAPSGERSMAACVNAFNAMFGKDLTETQGWQFMVLLKMARSRNKFNPDDYEDGAAYTGLAGEAHSNAK